MKWSLQADVLDQLGAAPPIVEWREDARGKIAVVGQYKTLVAHRPWPQTTVLAAETARPWLLPPVYAHLQHAPERFLAELRNSVTVFVRFSGIDFDHDDEAGEKLNTYVCQVQDVLTRYDGFLLQITMGDKGGYLHASFGAPVAHEDDGERAATAAIEICEVTDALGYLDPAQIGISSGLVHSGAYGSPERSTYGVIGNDVNISARLMAAAEPGQILVSTGAQAMLAESFMLAPLPPLALKGLREPLAVWALKRRLAAGDVSAGDAANREMISREAEQQLIDDALSELQAGQSSVMVIEGEAGIGKSLLIQELIRTAGALDDSDGNLAVPSVLAGYGDAVEQSTPYYAWRPIFEKAFGLTDGVATTVEARDRVVEMLDPDERHLAPLLNVILPLDLPETPLIEQIVGEARQDNIHQLLVGVLQRLAGVNPLVLIIDDAQWLDSVSWTLARRVQRDVEPLLLVLVTRPMGDETPQTYAALCQLPNVRPVLLDALPPGAIDQLVSRRLGVSSLPPQIAGLIRDKAEGHPFFSEELAYALRDRGLIAV